MSNNQKIFFFQYDNEAVLKWLEKINLVKYKEIFKSNKINGNDLFYLNNEDIKSELKINNIHDRYKLIIEINKLKNFKIYIILNFKEEKLKLNLDFEPSITLEKIFPLICNVLQIQKVKKII
jgi:hypothetical protein